ncbi:MAG: hypothetical protein PHX51_00830 [Clostridia bacterium]|nr:hypothetical protein [Clostridia bacterium]
MDIQIEKSSIYGTPNLLYNKSYIVRHLICCMLAKTKPPIFDIKSDDIDLTYKATESLRKILRKRDKVEHTEINCGDNATLLRLLLPVTCALGLSVNYLLSDSLAHRPHSLLIDELTRMGANITIENNLIIARGKLVCGDYTICGNLSSQYVSGLLLALPLLDGDCKLYVTPPFYSRGYADMTVCEMQRFGVTVKRDRNTYYTHKSSYGYRKTCFENDYSNNAFFIACGLLSGEVTSNNLHSLSLQPDRRIIDLLPELGASFDIKTRSCHSSVLLADLNVTVEKSTIKPIDVDMSNCPDLILPVCALLSTADGVSSIRGVRRLVHKESNRMDALIYILSELGVKTTVSNNKITICGKPSFNGGITFPSFNDHRIVMMLSVLALACDNPIVIKDYECVNKSFRDYFPEYNRLGGKTKLLCANNGQSTDEAKSNSEIIA